MEKMKLQGEDKEVPASMGLLPACASQDRHQHQENNPGSGLRKRGRGKREKRGGGGRMEPSKEGPGPKDRILYPLPSRQALTRW